LERCVEALHLPLPAYVRPGPECDHHDKSAAHAPRCDSQAADRSDELIVLLVHRRLYASSRYAPSFYKERGILSYANRKRPRTIWCRASSLISVLTAEGR